MDIEKLTKTQYEIIGGLAEAMAKLGATSGLLSIVGSWGDTLPENEILAMLNDWNKLSANPERNAMELKYPKSATSIDDMCEIIKFFRIKPTEYTDCAILYEVTFDQLRAMYNLGKDHAGPSPKLTGPQGPV